jgi:hypothetical protein
MAAYRVADIHRDRLEKMTKREAVQWIIKTATKEDNVLVSAHAARTAIESAKINCLPAKRGFQARSSTKYDRVTALARAMDTLLQEIEQTLGWDGQIDRDGARRRLKELCQKKKVTENQQQ